MRSAAELLNFMSFSCLLFVQYCAITGFEIIVYIWNHKKDPFKQNYMYRYHTVQYHVILLTHEYYTINMYKCSEYNITSPQEENIFATSTNAFLLYITSEE